jgi:hypothetical protein
MTNALRVLETPDIHPQHSRFSVAAQWRLAASVGAPKAVVVTKSGDAAQGVRRRQAHGENSAARVT